nr:hypothetical protein [Amycolatopsis sp.]
MHRKRVLGLAAVAVLLTGCGGGPQPARAESALVAVDGDGAVVYDLADGTYRGVDRSGREAWRFGAELGDPADVVCLRHCPDAVFSGGGPASRVTNGKLERFGEPGRVLSAHDDHLVVAEENAIRFTGAGREPSAGWVENAAGTSAVTVSPGVRWFDRDGGGWRPGTRADRPGDDACLSPDGRTALVLGEAAALVGRDGPPVVLATDLPGAPECVFGAAGAVLVEHTVRGEGVRHTAMRAVDRAGKPLWARDFDSEVFVAADPRSPRFALSGAARFELLDAGGGVLAGRDDVVSAAFTAGGELVTVLDSGAVSRS